LPSVIPMAVSRRHYDLQESAGNGDGFNRQQLLWGELKADPEHEQDDTDLREIARDRLVGHEAGRKWSHGDAGQEITHKRRHA